MGMAQTFQVAGVHQAPTVGVARKAGSSPFGAVDVSDHGTTIGTPGTACFQMGKVNPIERLHHSGSSRGPGAVGVSIMSKSPPNFVCHVPSKCPHGKPSLGAKGREWACSLSEQQRAGTWSTPSSNQSETSYFYCRH